MAKSTPSHAGTLYLVHVLTHSTRTRLDEALRPIDLSAFQYTILSVLARHADLSSARLSRRFHVTPQAMGEVILLLEKKGLIERREDPANKKALLLSLTKPGLQACQQGDLIVAKLEQMIFAGHTDAEIKQLRNILTKALATLGDR